MVAKKQRRAKPVTRIDTKPVVKTVGATAKGKKMDMVGGHRNKRYASGRAKIHVRIRRRVRVSRKMRRRPQGADATRGVWVREGGGVGGAFVTGGSTSSASTARAARPISRTMASAAPARRYTTGGTETRGWGKRRGGLSTSMLEWVSLLQSGGGLFVCGWASDQSAKRSLPSKNL